MSIQKKSWLKHRPFRFYAFLLIGGIIALILFCNLVVILRTSSYLYSDIEDVPVNKAGLLLGTSRLRSDGNPNLFFLNRIKATAELYKAGRISVIIISGDNGTKYYNEPRDMKRALLKLGVPDSVIYCDYAGFSTFDSVVRCRDIFGQQSFTIISQKFHNQRAVYIAQHEELSAVAFNAEDSDLAGNLFIKSREILAARIKLFMDLYFINKKPVYGGERIIVK